MTTAFVLSGGASLGAVQVGMLRALADRGARPDFWVGSSVGALNATHLAGRDLRAGVDELADLWRSIRRPDVFPVRPAGLLGIAGRRSSVVSAVGLERLLRRHLAFDHLEQARTPVHVVAADVITGDDVRFSTGTAVDAVLASAAIPGIFPPVERDGRVFMDGGFVNNTPISHAVELGAERVYVLSTGHACALPAPPASPIAMALHAMGVLVNNRLAADVAAYRDRVDLQVVPALCPLAVAPSDFGHTDELIERGRLITESWLDGGGGICGAGGDVFGHQHGVPAGGDR